jgi:hypothetical protein
MEENAPVQQKRWLMFEIQPRDLFRLLQLIAEKEPKLHATHFPPDTHTFDAFYDQARDYFVTVLESQFFEAVPVTHQDGRWAGPFNELLFELDEVSSEEEVRREEMWSERPVTPRDIEPHPGPPWPPEGLMTPEQLAEARWEVFWVTPDQLLQVLRLIADQATTNAPTFPPDTRVVAGTWDVPRRAFGLILHSQFFEPMETRVEDGAQTMTLPQRFLTIQRPPAPP